MLLAEKIKAHGMPIGLTRYGPRTHLHVTRILYHYFFSSRLNHFLYFTWYIYRLHQVQWVFLFIYIFLRHIFHLQDMLSNALSRKIICLYCHDMTFQNFQDGAYLFILD